MDTYQQHKQRLLNLIQSTIAFAQTYKQKDIKRRLDEAAQHLSQGKLIVVVCGEFKQGKSSLINALLEESGLFPVEVDITTNLVSTIAYGPQERINVILGTQGEGKSRTITRAEIPQYVTEQQNRGNKQEARMLIIESPNEKLREGLIIADTPGLGSLNIQHTEITYAYIPNADAVIFVSDAHTPLSDVELKFLTDKIARYCQNIIYVLTKIDEKTDYQAIVESNREKLAQVMGKPGDSINIVPVSSHNKLDYLKSGDPEDLLDSNFKAFEDTLWKLLTEQRGNILLTRALGELGASVAEMKGPIQIEWEACQQLNKRELDNLEAQFRQAREHHQSLLENDAVWRKQLNYGLNDVHSSVLGRFEEGFREIRREANAYMDDALLVQNPEQIAGLLEVDIDALLTDTGRQLSLEAAELQAKVEAASGLNLNPFEVAPLALQKANLPAKHVEIKRTGWWAKALEVTRTATFNGTAGGTLGTIIGGAVGGVVGSIFGGVGAIPGAYIGGMIGGALGSIGGATSGLRQGLTQVQEKDHTMARRKISEHIMPYLEEMKALCAKDLTKTMTKLDRHMQDELLNQIRREMKTGERTLQSVQEARKLTQAQADQRAAELKKLLQQLERIQKEMDEMASIVVPQVAAQRTATTQVATVAVVTADGPVAENAAVDESAWWADE
jgi:predicted GTPase